MHLLLDTHVALWAITDDPKLSTNARELLLAPRCHVWVSAVNVWEIAIKHSLGKETMPISGQEALHYFRRAGYQFLAVEPEHAAIVGDLGNHHQDPFDRLLVEQALAEPMRLLTHDVMVSRYSDTIILV
ncbi:type II toxin-antitoxin system VapC family toxin [Glaciimonas sp. GG7]